MATVDTFNSKRELPIGGHYFAIAGLDENGMDTTNLPYSIRILLEGALRGNDGFLVTDRRCTQYCILDSKRRAN